MPRARAFISYRRNDTKNTASELADELRKRLIRDFGSDVVFQDTSSIEPAEKFRQRIWQAIAECDVFVVLMGKDWAPERLQDPNDIVRFEITTALWRDDVAILPVAVDTELPAKEKLPSSVAGLLDWNATRISLGEHHEQDMQQLVTRIDEILRRPRRRRLGEVEQPTIPAPMSHKAERRRWLVLAGVLIILAIGIGERSIVGACGRNIAVVRGGSLDQRKSIKSYFANAAGAEGWKPSGNFATTGE